MLDVVLEQVRHTLNRVPMIVPVRGFGTETWINVSYFVAFRVLEDLWRAMGARVSYDAIAGNSAILFEGQPIAQESGMDDYRIRVW